MISVPNPPNPLVTVTEGHHSALIPQLFADFIF
jgi:hypothetical protein